MLSPGGYLKLLRYFMGRRDGFEAKGSCGGGALPRHHASVAMPRRLLLLLLLLFGARAYAGKYWPRLDDHARSRSFWGRSVRRAYRD
jgi:hypothetical protein